MKITEDYYRKRIDRARDLSMHQDLREDIIDGIRWIDRSCVILLKDEMIKVQNQLELLYQTWECNKDMITNCRTNIEY